MPFLVSDESFKLLQTLQKRLNTPVMNHLHVWKWPVDHKTAQEINTIVDSVVKVEVSLEKFVREL